MTLRKRFKLCLENNMITASSLIEDVARYLSDYEEDEAYVHWTREDLLSYFKRAVGIVATTNQKKFYKKTEIKLVEGVLQDVPDICESDVSVYGLADENGVVTQRARRSRIGSYPKLGRPVCSGRVKSDAYKLNSYDIDPENPRQIIVDPPVPAGVDATLVISCYQPPVVTGEESSIELGAELEAAVFELMLYYAWGVDIEDVANRERSNTHWHNAMTILKLSLEMQVLAKKVAR